MNRKAINGGGWFDDDRAVLVSEERTHFDGQNHVSEATGSQWEHQRLLRTAKGQYLLHSWSQWQGSGEAFARLSEQEAAEWCARFGRRMPKALVALAEVTEA